MVIPKRLFGGMLGSAVAVTTICLGAVAQAQDTSVPAKVEYVYVFPDGHAQWTPNVRAKKVRLDDLPQAQRQELLGRRRRTPERFKDFAERFTPVLAPTDATRVHVLVACDTDAGGGISPGVKLNRDRMEKVLTDGFRGRDKVADITVFTGANVTRDRILSYFQNLDSRASETLVFYYSGHGGSRPAGKEFQHYLALTHGTALFRADLRRTMESKPHQSTILITDCCSNHKRYDRRQMERARHELAYLFGEDDPAQMPSDVDRRTIDCLFLRHTGVIDITAASPSRDQFSWSNDQIGGLFTYALVRALRSDVNSINQGRNRKEDVVNWQQAFSRIQVWAAGLSLSRPGLPPIEELKKAKPDERDRLWQWAHTFSFH